MSFKNFVPDSHFEVPTYKKLAGHFGGEGLILNELLLYAGSA